MRGATLRCGAGASHCHGFSCCGARALDAWASIDVACGLSSRGSRALERRLSSCGTRTHLLHGTWDPPGPGLEPTSPALAGGLPTTAPPGKPQNTFFKTKYFRSLQMLENIIKTLYLSAKDKILQTQSFPRILFLQEEVHNIPNLDCIVSQNCFY